VSKNLVEKEVEARPRLGDPGHPEAEQDFVERPVECYRGICAHIVQGRRRQLSGTDKVFTEHRNVPLSHYPPGTMTAGEFLEIAPPAGRFRMWGPKECQDGCFFYYGKDFFLKNATDTGDERQNDCPNSGKSR
jgi:hypothetical protein